MTCSYALGGSGEIITVDGGEDLRTATGLSLWFKGPNGTKKQKTLLSGKVVIGTVDTFVKDLNETLAAFTFVEYIREADLFDVISDQWLGALTYEIPGDSPPKQIQGRTTFPIEVVEAIFDV